MRVSSPPHVGLRRPRLVAVIALLSLLLIPASSGPSFASSPPQGPGTFTGLGFDTCQAPSQDTMSAWKSASPFGAIGIYVSGNSRYCGDAYQPNLTPGWIQTNADLGWRFLPIHVGYQSPCFSNNPDSRVQKRKMSSDLGTARGQAASDAGETIAALRKLGFGPGSVSYLDLEWYHRSTACDNVTLEFIDAWTETLHANGYSSGVYSSGSAAIKAMDDALSAGRPGFNPPDHVWFAWTNKVADTNSGPYLKSRFFTNHQRIHQYENGVTVTYGGKKLNIDRNSVDVSGTAAPVPAPPAPVPAPAPPAPAPAPTEHLSSKVAKAAAGSTPKLKRGSSGDAVKRLQKALQATGSDLPATGFFGDQTAKAVKSYRSKNNLGSGSKVTKDVWAALQRGVDN